MKKLYKTIKILTVSYMKWRNKNLMKKLNYYRKKQVFIREINLVNNIMWINLKIKMKISQNINKNKNYTKWSILIKRISEQIVV